MIIVQKTVMPPKSAVSDYMKPIDYADSYKMKLPETCYAGIDELAHKLFNSGPSWTETLMKIRNILVAPFGLKTELPETKYNGKELKPGDKVAFLTVYARTLNEIIMGGRDTHLDFCVSLYLESVESGRELTVTTTVKYNNRLGKFYFFFVRPFHARIVPAGMKYNFK